MKMLIPNCKTELILKEPWTFRLFFERRNDALLKAVGLYGGGGNRWDSSWRTQDGGYRSPLRYGTVTLPAGTVLRTSRVYIRQGTTDTFDSLTFTIKSCPDKRYKGRFWAKLGDINGKMDAEIYLGTDSHKITEQERVSRIAMLFED
jgi:hypothetical protein